MVVVKFGAVLLTFANWLDLLPVGFTGRIDQPLDFGNVGLTFARLTGK